MNKNGKNRLISLLARNACSGCLLGMLAQKDCSGCLLGMLVQDAPKYAL